MTTLKEPEYDVAPHSQLAINIFSSWAANLIKMVIQVAMLPLLARLCGPSEIGLYSLALPIVVFVSMVADGGIGESLAREDGVDADAWSTAFWTLLVLGLVLAGAAYGASFIVAAVAGQPRLPNVILALSATLVMVASTVVPGALMLKSGKTAPGAWGDLVGNVVGAAVAIVAAVDGAGVWALVAQYLTTYSIRMLSFNILAPFKPKWIWDLRHLHRHSSVGGAIVGARLADTITKAFENSQVSRLFGVQILGFYSYANQIPKFINEAVSNAVWHNLYYLNIAGAPGDVLKNYLSHSRFLAILLFPTGFVSAVVMSPLVTLTLGEKWTGASGAMAVLFATYPFVVLGSQAGAVFYAKGLTVKPLGCAVSLFVGRVIMVFSGFATSIFNLSLGFGLLNVLFFVASSIFCLKYLDFKWTKFIDELKYPFLSALGTALCVRVMGARAEILNLGSIIIFSIVCYFSLLYILDRTRILKDVAQLRALLKTSRGGAQR